MGYIWFVHFNILISFNSIIILYLGLVNLPWTSGISSIARSPVCSMFAVCVILMGKS